MSERSVQLSNLCVRRWGEDDATPIVLDHRNMCGTYSDHLRRGCIGLALAWGGRSGLVHLTTAEALRLSDLLRAMASTNESAADGEQAPTEEPDHG